MLINNPHIQTIIPALFARGSVSYRRETIELDDGDFLDLDWACENMNPLEKLPDKAPNADGTLRVGSKLVVYVHGMAGSSEGWYVKRCISRLESYGFSALAMNLRGCGGGTRRPSKTYHSGMTEDLHAVIEHVLANYNYKEIYLVGFSLGGNIILKYLGEQSIDLHKAIQKAIVFSVPIDLQSSAEALARSQGQIYMRYLMSKLGTKLNKNLSGIKSFHEYDRLYTAPQHGFKDEYDYWQQASSRNFLEFINIPTMIVNALDDPFLGPACYPGGQIKNEKLEFISPKHGGHVGFMTLSLQWFKQGYWFPRMKMDFQHEQYVVDFLVG